MKKFLYYTIMPALAKILKSIILSAIQSKASQKPHIRDKEGTRKYLEDSLKMIAYLAYLFIDNNRTIQFVVANMLKYVEPGNKWDALYQLMLLDSGYTTNDLIIPTPTIDKKTIRERLKALLVGNTTMAANEIKDKEAELYVKISGVILESTSISSAAEQTYIWLTRGI